MVNDYIKCLQNVSNVFEVATIDAAVHCNKTLWTTNAEEKNGNWDKKGTQNCCHCHSDPAGHFWCPHLFSYSTNSLIWCCFCTGLWNSETPETVFDILRHSIFSIYLYLTTLEIGRPPWSQISSLPNCEKINFSCLNHPSRLITAFDKSLLNERIYNLLYVIKSLHFVIWMVLDDFLKCQLARVLHCIC